MQKINTFSSADVYRAMEKDHGDMFRRGFRQLRATTTASCHWCEHVPVSLLLFA